MQTYRQPPLLVTAQDRSGNRSPPKKGSFEVPKRLMEAKHPEASTVYTLRLSTGVQRGSAQLDPASGVFVALVGADGSALLRRIPPIPDPAQELQLICTDAGDGIPAGADCELAMKSPPGSPAGGAATMRRFQQGGVDEVSIKGPELGPLQAVLVGPESGSWRCDELDVSSSSSGRTERFVCREQLGGAGEQSAAYLLPVPAGGVVYGSGDAAVVLTREQAAQLHEWNMQQYSDLKTRLMAATVSLVGMGTGVTYAFAGPDLAVPFALGGASSLAYQYLLQRRVDGIAAARTPRGEAKPADVQPGLALSASLALSRPAVRAALMAAGLLGSLALTHLVAGQHELGDVGAGAARHGAAVSAEVRQVAAGLAGFLMHKAALVGVATLPAPSWSQERLSQPRQGADHVE